MTVNFPESVPLHLRAPEFTSPSVCPSILPHSSLSMETSALLTSPGFTLLWESLLMCKINKMFILLLGSWTLTASSKNYGKTHISFFWTWVERKWWSLTRRNWLRENCRQGQRSQVIKQNPHRSTGFVCWPVSLEKSFVLCVWMFGLCMLHACCLWRNRNFRCL